MALLDLIDMLPDASRFNEARVNDPEYAEMVAGLPDPEGEWSPRVAAYGLNELLLREILHELKANNAITLKAAGGSPGEFKEFPAPRTAVHAARERLERDWAINFAGRFGFTPDDV